MSDDLEEKVPDNNSIDSSNALAHTPEGLPEISQAEMMAMMNAVPMVKELIENTVDKICTTINKRYEANERIQIHSINSSAEVESARIQNSSRSDLTTKIFKGIVVIIALVGVFAVAIFKADKLSSELILLVVALVAPIMSSDIGNLVNQGIKTPKDSFK